MTDLIREPSIVPQQTPKTMLDGPTAPTPPLRIREHKLPTRRQPAELMARAKEQLRGLIGYTIDGVAGFNKIDGGWHLSVMAVELHRIPPATDVLAMYDVKLDDMGDIVSYRRGDRYFRGQVGDMHDDPAH